MKRLPLEPASFDFVFSYIVFQHLPTLAMVERYLRECGRVLSPGGRLRVQVNTRRRSLLDRVSLRIVPSRRVPVLGRKLRFKIDPHDHMGVVLREAECRGLVADAGLRLLDLGPVGEQYTWIAAERPSRAEAGR